MLAKNVKATIASKWARRIAAIGGVIYVAGWFVTGIRMGIEIAMGAMQ